MSRDGIGTVESPSAAEQSQRYSGRHVAFVGKLGATNRRDARSQVRRAGGTPCDPLDPRVNVIVIGADQNLSDDYAQLLSDEVLTAAGKGTLEILSETEFWQRLGLVDSESDGRRLYTPAMLSDLLGVPLATIRRWHRRGLITPVRQVNRLPYFDFEEVASARQIANLIASGQSPQLIEAKLTRLAEMSPTLRRPLSQLSIIVEGQSVLLRQDGGLVEPGGQLRFDFAALETPGPERLGQWVSDVLSFPEASGSDWDSPPTTADEFLTAAIDLEDEGRLEQAVDVYRSMALALGPTPDVCFRIAELLYQMGDLPAARERYYTAVELESGFVEARASLGCVLVELRQLGLAEAAFRGALDVHPDYPDVHFHLARLLDELDRPIEARAHWDHFLRLAPRSPWADEARQRLGLAIAGRGNDEDDDSWESEQSQEVHPS